MTELKTIENYVIKSKKDDHVVPDWCDNAMVFIFIITIFAFLFSGAFIKLSRVDIMFIFAVIFLIECLGFVMTMTHFGGCGITICWFDRNDGRPIDVTSFKLSGDSDTDAKKLKKIVEEYERDANNMIERKKMMEESARSKEKECCDAYRKVIEKVKNDNN
jgi:hypothetical protein